MTAVHAEGFVDRLKDRAVAWAKANLETIFWIARNTLPILIVAFKGQKWALVTRYDDVQEVLLRPDVFNVVYEPKIRLIMDGDNIFLGMKDIEPATRDKTTMRMTAPRAEATTYVKPRNEALANEIMNLADGRVDIAMQLTQEVTTRFFNEYIGTTDIEVKTISDQARLLFGFMFADLGNDPALRAKAVPVAAELRAYVERTIATRKGERGKHDDILERCLKQQDMGSPGMDDRGIRNNLIGLIVGALPQAPMLIPQLFDILLDRPKELAAACEAARRDDDDLVSKYVFEASRYYPLTPGLFRQCLEDYKLGGGYWRGRTIRRGTQVLAATRSAMFDGRKVSSPSEFRLDRPDYAYFHFGYGMHQCFGLHMNRVMVPAICKAVLKKPNLRRAPGDAGKLKVEGIFPTRLMVQFDP